MSTKSAARIYLRHDQKLTDVGAFNDPQIGIFAPTWVKEGLKILGTELNGVTFDVLAQKTQILKSFTITDGTLSLKELQCIARNEDANCSGKYCMEQYGPISTKHGVIVALKDLVRQCIIVGPDVSTHYGGYPRSNSRTKQKANTRVYLCDLAALQFQKYYNTGRLVLIQKHSAIEGVLDDFIFSKVVGEPKKSYEDAQNDTSGRYISITWFSSKQDESFFDVHAYRKFVALDVILSGLAISQSASRNKDKINFKFLKYGSGFFAGSVSKLIDKYILSGVVMGLEELFEKHGDAVKDTIKHVEFPFYNENDQESIQKLQNLKDKFGLEYSFSLEDALKSTKKFVTATTNCGDSCVVFGNEMHFGSVDAAIAENLRSKGNKFCPILNEEIQEYFLLE